MPEGLGQRRGPVKTARTPQPARRAASDACPSALHAAITARGNSEDLLSPNRKVGSQSRQRCAGHTDTAHAELAGGPAWPFRRGAAQRLAVAHAPRAPVMASRVRRSRYGAEPSRRSSRAAIVDGSRRQAKDALQALNAAQCPAGSPSPGRCSSQGGASAGSRGTSSHRAPCTARNAR